MPKTLMLALTLLVSTALLTGQDYPQPGSSQTGTTDAGQTVPQGCFKGKESARMNEHGSLHAEGQSQTERHTRGLAKAKVTVQNSEAKPYDQIAGAALVEIHLTETFAGELDGESPVRALQLQRDDHSASLVSMQRFHGRLGGRQGTFVLQGSEIVNNGKIKATWFVVPGSATGDLTGLCGEGGFEGDFGKGSDATLNYWFE